MSHIEVKRAIEIPHEPSYTHPLRIWWWSMLEGYAEYRRGRHSIKLAIWMIRHNDAMENIRRALEDNVVLARRKCQR